MNRTAILVLLVDVVLVVAMIFVIQDLQWRASYASSLHYACPQPCSYSSSFSYSVLSRFFTMSGNGVSLTSPPNIDWVQVLAVLLVAINAWFAYTILSKRRTARPGMEASPVTMASK